MSARRALPGGGERVEGAGSSGLLPSVVQALAEAGLSEADYVSRFSGDGLWYGDECGCSDDRCIGFHHAAAGDCGCFPVLLDQALDTLAVQASSSTDRSGQVWQASGEPAAVEVSGDAAAEFGEAGL